MMQRSYFLFVAICLMMSGCASTTQNANSDGTGQNDAGFMSSLTQGVKSAAIAATEAAKNLKSALDDAARASSHKAGWRTLGPYKINVKAAKLQDGTYLNKGGSKILLDGFRELKWESEPKSSMVSRGKKSVFDIYTIKNDDLAIGSASLEKIEYRYIDNKLHSVVLTTKDLDHGQLLLRTLDKTYGRGVAPDSASQTPHTATFHWMNNTMRIAATNYWVWNLENGYGEMRCDVKEQGQVESRGVCRTVLSSKIMWLDEQLALNEQIDEATNDL